MICKWPQIKNIPNAQNGVLSKKSWIEETGRDPAIEKQRLAVEEQQNQMIQQQQMQQQAALGIHPNQLALQQQQHPMMGAQSEQSVYQTGNSDKSPPRRGSRKAMRITVQAIFVSGRLRPSMK